MIKWLLVMLVLLAVPVLLSAQEEAAPDTAESAATTAAEKQAPELKTETAEEAMEQTETEPEVAVVETALTIESMAFCTGVEEREPVGEAAEFTSDVGTLYFWSNVLNSGDETTVSHNWYLNGEEKASVELPARYPRNRVWSSKIIPAEWTGEWKVEVVSESGDVLGAKICVVK
jgi:hypothetical protein